MPVHRSLGQGLGLARRPFLVAAVSFLAGCAGSDDGPLIPSTESGGYLLGPGDQVRVLTFGEDQLTGTFNVDAAGDVTLPLIDAVHASGLTPHQLGKKLAKILRDTKLYNSPSVSVEVISYRPVFLVGEVSKPGQYAYQPGMSVVTAVAVSGGFTYRAKKDVFSIVRSTPTGTVEGTATRETLVQPGDVITVHERIF